MVLDFSVPEKSIAISMLNVYSSMIIKTHSLTALFDPIEINPDKFSNIDVIIVTHEHVDHFNKDLLLQIQEKTSAPVLTTPFVAGRLGSKVDLVKPLVPGNSFKIKDTTFHAQHCEHSANQPLSFVIETDAATIYHPSDSSYFPGMESIRDKYKPELMVYIGNSWGNLMDIAPVIRPQLIIALAYPMSGEITITGMEVVMLKQFEVYYYQKESQEEAN